jgi:predicted site-specific integrase-resolvase
MRILDGKVYLSPQEAGALLHVSYKTLQRWVDEGARKLWVRNGHRELVRYPVEVDVQFTATGYRLYNRESIERLRADLDRERAEAQKRAAEHRATRTPVKEKTAA